MAKEERQHRMLQSSNNTTISQNKSDILAQQVQISKGKHQLQVDKANAKAAKLAQKDDFKKSV